LEVNREYRESDEGCSKQNKCDRSYRKTEQGKESNAKYSKTEKGKASVANCSKTKKGKASVAKYSKTEKGKASFSKYMKAENLFFLYYFVLFDIENSQVQSDMRKIIPLTF